MAVTVRPPVVLPWLWLGAAAVVATEIPYPLVRGEARDALTVATVVVFAVTSCLHAFATRGARYTVVLLVVAGCGGFAAELAGVHTGIPFGDYRYTGGLGPTLGAVPVVIAAAWVMMAHPARVVAETLTRGRPARVVVTAAALASWDVFLDPQMVHAEHWRWADPAPHLPGVGDVPLTNFGGWLLVALVVAAALDAAAPTAAGSGSSDLPMIALWLWTWLSSTLANLAFFGRPAVAGWGFVAMGLVGVPLLLRLRQAA
jgi:uncharacterized membrane protein